MCDCGLEERETFDAELVEMGIWDADLVEAGTFDGELGVTRHCDAEFVETETALVGDLVETGEIDDGLVEMAAFEDDSDDFGDLAVADGEVDSPFRSNMVTASRTFSTTPISPGPFFGLIAADIT